MTDPPNSRRSFLRTSAALSMSGASAFGRAFDDETAAKAADPIREFLRPYVLDREVLDGFLDPRARVWARFDPTYGYLLRNSFIRDGVDGSSTLARYEPAGLRRQFPRPPLPAQHLRRQLHPRAPGQRRRDLAGSPRRALLRADPELRRRRLRRLSGRAAVDGGRSDRTRRGVPDLQHLGRRPLPKRLRLPASHLSAESDRGDQPADVSREPLGPRAARSRDLRADRSTQPLPRRRIPSQALRPRRPGRGVRRRRPDPSPARDPHRAGRRTRPTGGDRQGRSARRARLVDPARDSPFGFGPAPRPRRRGRDAVDRPRSCLCPRTEVAAPRSLVYPQGSVRHACQGTPGFNTTDNVDWHPARFKEFLKQRGIPFVDTIQAHVDEFRDFKISAKEYVDRYYIGHYNPRGNHFFAYAVKDAICRFLDPQPAPYRTGAEAAAAFDGYLPG